MNLQPSWHCVANYGDVDPFNHGGEFLMIDRRGVYDPELWIYDPDLHPNAIYCIVLEQCHKIDDHTIGDNRFHPEKITWFGEREELQSVSNTMDIPVWKLMDHLCGNPYERAIAYKALADYHGYVNFDSSPWLVGRSRIKKLIKKCQVQINKASNWEDGFPI